MLTQTGDKIMEDENSKNELSIQKDFKIFVNKKEVLNYDFSYLKNGIKEVIDSIGIKMGQLGCHLPEYVKDGMPFGSISFVMIVPPNCLHFKSESDVDSGKIKTALDEVKDIYLETHKRLQEIVK